MISVIICHHKGRTLLENSIKSLQASMEVDFEIIVVTSDETLLEMPGVRIIQQAGGPAHKRNIGVKFASSEYIAFFDDDIETKQYALWHMWNLLKRAEVGMVYGKLLNMEYHDRFDEAGSYLTSTGFLWARAESGCKDIGQFEKVEEVLAGKSAACMIKRRIFWEVGGFDASYEILGEETDLSWRVWLAGYRVLYVPSSVTFHAFGTSLKPKEMYTNKRVFFNGCRNYLSLIYTNFGKKRWIIPLMIQIVVWTCAAIGMFITGKRDESINIFKGIKYFLFNIKTIWHKRYKVQSSRKVSDKELLPIIQKTPSIRYYIERFFSYIKQAKHGGSYNASNK